MSLFHVIIFFLHLSLSLSFCLMVSTSNSSSLPLLYFLLLSFIPLLTLSFLSLVPEVHKFSTFPTVTAISPELQLTFIEQTLQPGPPVSLRCSASGNPPPRITWLLDGGELMPRGYVLGSYLDSANNVISHMNISSVRVQHGGLYTCVARNVLGAVQHSAMLNIYGKLLQYRKVSTETSNTYDLLYFTNMNFDASEIYLFWKKVVLFHLNL